MSDSLKITKDNPAGFDTFAVNQGQITAYADSVADSGVDTTVTSAGHGITAEMVTNNWKVTISGSTAAQYDGTHKVTRIIDADNFDIAKVFGTDAGDGAFLVERIYPLRASILTAARVIRPSGTGGVFVSLQELKADDLQSSDIKWGDSLATGTNEFVAGQNNHIHGIKVTGNPISANQETFIIINQIFPRP